MVKGLKLKRQLKVLVVDDSLMQRMILTRQLSIMGVQAIKEVDNGQKAVDLHLAGAVYDLIFIDNEMPVMTGPQATRKLRSMGVGSMMVGVSTNCMDGDKEEFLSAGLDKLHGKPINMNAIMSILQEVDSK